VYASSPFEQFQVNLLYNYSDLYLTDTLLVSIFIFFLFQISYFFLNFIDHKYYISLSYLIYNYMYYFIYNTIYSYLSEEGKKYFPFLLFLFFFICISNLIGILPYSFTITSHLSITFSLAFIIWYGMFIGVGINKYGLWIFSMFFPKTIPFRLVPLLVFIEVVSFIFRSISLALRLFANIVAGHILLDTIALVIYKMIYPTYFIFFQSIILVLIPILITIILIIFECIVAILQGYIFIVLACIYLKDMIDVH
jgi:F-type H+-transporting ATPase subunit a